MTNAKHTSGPWTIEGADTEYFQLVAPGPKRIGVFSKKGFSYPERKANARLIAAAPTMLEALQRCMEVLEITDTPCSDARDMTRKAIAKATQS